MDKELRNIPRGKKIDFLKKLQSGKYKLLPPIEPQPKLNFDLQGDSLYLCREDRRLMTADEIKTLPGYQIVIELINTQSQAKHEEPAAGYCLIPFSKQDLLSGILVSIEGDETFGGNFDEALSRLTTEELKHLHRQLEYEAKKGNSHVD